MIIAITDTADRAACIARMASVERWGVDGATLPEMLAGATLLDVVEDGQPVGAIALVIEGDTATVTAAASRGQGTAAEIELLHDALRAKGVARVRLMTRRPGAIRRTIGHGYQVKACELIKDL